MACYSMHRPTCCCFQFCEGPRDCLLQINTSRLGEGKDSWLSPVGCLHLASHLKPAALCDNPMLLITDTAEPAEVQELLPEVFLDFWLCRFFPVAHPLSLVAESGAALEL